MAREILGAHCRRNREKRAQSPIEKTTELADIIRSAMPGKALREKQHPGQAKFPGDPDCRKRRAAGDFGLLEAARQTASRRQNLRHHIPLSEDRLVKNAFAAREHGCTCPRDFPVCVCGFVPTLKVITKRPVVPDRKKSRKPESKKRKAPHCGEDLERKHQMAITLRQ
jgi:16S rRNA (cytosine1402-N4)-methyltransferase